MLAAHDSRSNVLDSSALEIIMPEPGLCGLPTLVGRRIGQYQVTRLIASGGMGTVYEAQQDHPRRAIALKVMHHGSVSRSMLRRFEAEADILGRLQHPAIAPIHEAGVFETDDGPQPFFAMELIDGCSITEYAQRHNLGTRDRLALVLKVCEGVEHAHQRGVIHRDLKPANILVQDQKSQVRDQRPDDRRPQPLIRDLGSLTSVVKILDFGIARVTGADAATTTLRTGVGVLMGTLAYMSPEQVAGDPAKIDQQSDVFALGVIAYELLAGRMPHDLSRRSIPEALRIMRDEEPTPLSAVNRFFRGDLDTIVAKALEKDKSRRYRSVGEFAADIERFVRNEPVLARRPSSLYQLGKFARRNRILVGGIAAVFVALGSGVIATSWQWARATQQRNAADESRTAAVKAEADANARLEETRQLVWAMTEYADKDLARLPGGTAARERLMIEAAQRYMALAKDEDSGSMSPTTTLGLGYVHQRLGEVQLVMGKTREALAHFEQSLPARERQAAAMHDSHEFVRPLVVGHWKVAEVLRVLGRLDEAQNHHSKGLELLQRIEAKRPDPVSSHYFGAAHRRMAEIEADQGRHADAIEHYRQSVRHFEAAVGVDPDNMTTREGFAIALRGMGESLAALGQGDRGLDSINQSLEVIQFLADRSGSMNLADRTLRAASLNAKARVLLSMGRALDAANAAKDAAAIAESLAQADPLNFESRHLLARSLTALAQAQAHAVRVSDFQVSHRRALQLLEALELLDPDNALVRDDLQRAQALTRRID